MATHSIILTWSIPWTEEPGRLRSMGSQRVRKTEVTQHARNKLSYTNKMSLYPGVQVQKGTRQPLGGSVTVLKVRSCVKSGNLSPLGHLPFFPLPLSLSFLPFFLSPSPPPICTSTYPFSLFIGFQKHQDAIVRTETNVKVSWRPSLLHSHTWCRILLLIHSIYNLKMWMGHACLRVEDGKQLFLEAAKEAIQNGLTLLAGCVRGAGG